MRGTKIETVDTHGMTMSDKPQIDPQLTPVMEPNFDRKQIEAPVWLNELWRDGARSSVLIETERRGEKSGSGSGFFVDKDGYIATANHIVEKTSGLKVVTFDGQKIPAEVVATSPSEDLAIIRLRRRPTPESCSVLPIGETSSLTGDQPLFNIGHPRGEKLPFVSVGRFERLRWDLESSVPSVPGNSGGAIVDSNGRVVSVCLGVRYHSGHENMPRGVWIGDKPATEPASYSKDTSTKSASAESLALLLSRTDPKFTVTRYTTGWAGEHLNWVKESPLNPAIDAAGLGALTYGGGRLVHSYRPAGFGAGIAGGIMLASDGYQLYYSPEHQSVQGILAVAADLTTVAGSILRARYAKFGTTVIGLGLASRLGTEFVPTGVRLNIAE